MEYVRLTISDRHRMDPLDMERLWEERDTGWYRMVGDIKLVVRRAPAGGWEWMGWRQKGQILARANLDGRFMKRHWAMEEASQWASNMMEAETEADPLPQHDLSDSLDNIQAVM